MRTSQTPSPLSLLLVDDDDVDAESVLRSLRKHEVSCNTVIAEDGLEALDIMRGTHPNKELSAPFIVLLDLSMPKMDGFDFLTAVRADAALCPSVIFVLTTSSRDSDCTRAYRQNVAGYMVKSAVGPQFAKLAMLLRSYYESVDLPRSVS